MSIRNASSPGYIFFDRCFFGPDAHCQFITDQFMDTTWRPVGLLPCSEEMEKKEPATANLLYEKAIIKTPGSYKLWKAYLAHRIRQTDDKRIDDPIYEEVNFCFERAIVFMHKMPRVWINYLEFLVKQMCITKCRRTFDRALEALPITQHSRIWPLYLDFIRNKFVPSETAIRVFKRYMKLRPEDAEDFITYLEAVNRVDEAATLLCDVINREDFQSKYSKTKYELWNELCDMICRHADQIHSLEVDIIIRDGISRYHDQQGHLWNCLAEYYVRLGLFTKARDIYEEAMEKVMTVRDFSQIYDAYAQCEEAYNERLLESISTKAANEIAKDEETEIEMRLARYEDLVNRRPLLLNSVALRQNPHNVNEWQKRVKLFEEQPIKQIETFTQALKTIDPKQAVGKYHQLWIDFAKFYEENDQLDDARYIFDKATEATFVKTDDLAIVWCQYAELELRHNQPREAIKVLQRATAQPPKSADFFDTNQAAQHRVYRSLRLWTMYAELEEKHGTFACTKAVYDRILELRIATPQVVLDYGLFLEKNHYFEDAFSAYERGVSLFKWPYVYEIWNTYLTKFLGRYGSKKLERARDLFEQCLKDCPAKYAKDIYLLYAKLEESHGLAKKVLEVYDRATQAVLDEQKADIFHRYIRKVCEINGAPKTRPIYEKAIAELSDREARTFCMEFAMLELELGEIERARKLYAYCSQMCDPRIDKEFWNAWLEFETKFGNEDTIADMLRIKRSVQALFPGPVFLSDPQQVALIKENSTE
ncbi:Pre-mRNA-splicing factor syf1-like protein, partial [Fragariocoptes setiger]